MSTLRLMHYVLLLTPACWKSSNTNARLMAFTHSLALDPTFGIHSHKTLDIAQSCHLLKPNWKPSSPHSISAPSKISQSSFLSNWWFLQPWGMCCVVCSVSLLGKMGGGMRRMEPPVHVLHGLFCVFTGEDGGWHEVDGTACTCVAWSVLRLYWGRWGVAWCGWNRLYMCCMVFCIFSGEDGGWHDVDGTACTCVAWSFASSVGKKGDGIRWNCLYMSWFSWLCLALRHKMTACSGLDSQ